jgi:hypothetical protein
LFHLEDILVALRQPRVMHPSSSATKAYSPSIEQVFPGGTVSLMS